MTQHTQQKTPKSWYSKKTENSWWPNEAAQAQKNPKFNMFLGWIASPYNGDHIHIDEQGNRLTPTNPNDKNGKSKIYMFGGSALFGYNAKDNETIPSFLSLLLNNNSQPSYIYNFGQIGFTSYQDTTYLQQILKNNVIPNVVIFYNGCNDLFVNSESTIPQKMYDEKRIHQAIQSIPQNESVTNTSIFSKNSIKLLSSYAFSYIKVLSYPKMIFQKYILHQTLDKDGDTRISYNDEDINEISKKIANDYIHNAMTVEALSKQYGFSYILIWQPLIFSKTLTPEEKTAVHKNSESLQKIYTKATQIILDKKINHFYTINSIFQNYFNESIFTDTCHITPKGNNIVAESIKTIMEADTFNQTEKLIKYSLSASSKETIEPRSESLYQHSASDGQK